jgi:hypothetical protein
MQSTPDQQPDAVGTDDRRLHDRVCGPFDGLRLGALETPVRIFDLSEGGCFINSMHDQQVGIQVMIKIDLPYEGWITVKLETLYRKPGFGFAARFVEISDETAERLERALQKLRDRNPYDL